MSRDQLKAERIAQLPKCGECGSPMAVTPCPECRRRFVAAHRGKAAAPADDTSRPARVARRSE